MEVVNLSH